MLNPETAHTHSISTPFAHASGPRTATVALVGEAWGQQEALAGRPFIGASGQELTRLLAEAGIERSKCFLTNVFPLQPQSNDIENICVPKGLAAPDTIPLRQGKYIHPHLLPEVQRLKVELEEVKPNLILALGATAAWALLDRPAITQIRGAVADSTLIPGLKVLPTYHPAAVLRNWAMRPIVLADLLKAQREMAFPDIRRPEREVIVNPDIPTITAWLNRPALRWAVDIETWRGQITMIGFARSAQDAIVIPFVLPEARNYSYWSEEDEVQAWTLVKTALASPTPKVFQNGIYDIGYLTRLGLKVNSAHHDTMLLHHSLYPELQKGLGFLGSIYSNEASWKLMRKRSGDIVVKADE